MGYTHELDKRIKGNNMGLSRYIKSGLPWELVKYFESVSKSKAIELETKIKKRGIRRFLNDLETMKHG
ncbi:GIY-YIG nuclease family protein [bacterium]|nr:GIY-YIG nuclease family protein [bacterium]